MYDNLFSPACKYGNLKMVKYLISQGVKLTGRNTWGIIAASANGHLEVVKYLVSQGANVRTSNNCCLRLALENGHKEVYNYLKQEIERLENLSNDFKRL